MGGPLSLRKARESGRLEDFIRQEEARGVAPVDEAELMAALEATIKSPRSAGQTSRSASRGGSTEK